jgi:hypothetical protein
MDRKQCALPVLDGLLPKEFQGVVNKLVFSANDWYALAKLRLHTDSSLRLLERRTTDIGRLMRQYSRVTADVHMVELPAEVEKRKRHAAKVAQKNGDAQGSRADTSSGTARRRPFTFATFKAHNMGNYVLSIRQFGEVGSYSTERASRFTFISRPFQTKMICLSKGETEHKTVKRDYARTNKNQFETQISNLAGRRDLVTRIGAAIDAPQIHKENVPTDQVCLDDDHSSRYHIAKDEKSDNAIILDHWLYGCRQDPAFEVLSFFPLKSDINCHATFRTSNHS